MDTKRLLTQADVQDLLNLLRQKGLRPQLIGSIATVGHSEHDIDMSLPIRSRFLYNKYHNAMRLLGFQLIEGALDHIEHELETWQKEDIIVDVWMTE